MTVSKSGNNSVSAVLLRTPLIDQTTSQSLRDGRQRINRKSVTADNDGKLKEDLPGSTIAVALIDFLKRVKKLIALLCLDFIHFGLTVW